MTNNPILDVAIANLHNNNRAISAEVQVKRLRELNRELENCLVRAIDHIGYELPGPTDWRVAENGEPRWVCDARAAIAQSRGIQCS